ncbi:MAG: hypothetical protein V3V18_14305 [Methylococcales bacterium]
MSLSILLVINAGCSSTAEKQVDVLEPEQVSNMQFGINNPAEIFKTPLPKVKISSQVTANLTESGYSFITQDSNTYSHDLTVQVGSIKHGSTPVGFSFNAGNPNPRALDYQKSDVLPLTCSLISRLQPEQRADLTMDFVAKSYLSDTAQSSEDNILVEKLVNDMSTVCFNLLNNLQVKRQPRNHSNETAKSGWMPDVEIRNVSESDTETGTVTNFEVESQAEKKQDNTDFTGDVIQPVKIKQSGDEQLQEEVKKKVAVKQGKKESRKQLIINNQGSPLTIQFGHERK